MDSGVPKSNWVFLKPNFNFTIFKDVCKRDFHKFSMKKSIKISPPYTKKCLSQFNDRHFFLELLSRLELPNLFLTKEALYRLSYSSKIII